jgi:hypothetical protein
MDIIPDSPDAISLNLRAFNNQVRAKTSNFEWIIAIDDRLFLKSNADRPL